MEIQQCRGKNAKEESFGSSLSRKACGEHERQSLSVKEQRRRDHNQNNNDTNSYQTMRGYTKLYERVPKYTTVSFDMRE
jgi:hypothetical protein